MLLLAGCATDAGHKEPPAVSPTMGSMSMDRSALARSTSNRARADLDAIARGQQADAPAQAAAADKKEESLSAAAPLAANTPDISDFKQEGRASWYGPRFHGRRTANGERYDKNALTAAHRSLPLSSFVRVTNLTNQKSVIVRINDRGPFRRGRIIDVSQAAAKVLGLQHSGVAKVEVQGLSRDEARVAMAEQFASLK